MEKIDSVAYIEESASDLLLQDSLDILFDIVYNQNNPQVLIDITKSMSLDKLTRLDPPWGDDMWNFPDYMVRNFIKILLGYMGTQCNMDLKYGSWLITDVSMVKKHCRDKVLVLDMTNAVEVYKLEDGQALFMYDRVPEQTKTINPTFRIVK